MTRLNTASELFAISQSKKNSGRFECHWCSSPCGDHWVHDGAPCLPFITSPEPTKRPSNHYVCQACWLWRRKKVTVTFLNGGFKDGQTASKYSWWITEQGAWALRPPVDLFMSGNLECLSEDQSVLYQNLLKPPLKFSLSLIENPKINNYLQCMIVNDLEEIHMETLLKYTVNTVSIPLTYTIYGLEEALKNGNPPGTEPGVQTLIRLLGKYHIPVEEKREGAGRPKKIEDKRGKKVT